MAPMTHKTSLLRTAKHLASPPSHPSILCTPRRRYALFFVFLTYFRYFKIFLKILIVLNRIIFYSQHPPSYFHTYITTHTTPHITKDFVTADYAKEKGLTMKNLSGTKFRQMLRAGDDIPTW